MFRRKEDGSDMEAASETTTTPQTSNSAPAPANANNPAPAAPLASAPSAPSPIAPIATAPAAQPAPSFRPVAPAAAMAAARGPATPVNAPAAPAAPVAAAPVERMPATPVARPAQAKRVLTVGPEIQMKGEITSCDRVIIEGTVDATMRDVHTVELAESGALKGTAEVEDAEISGAFEGDLVVRGRLTVYSTGRLRGNVTYGEIEIQRGGQISGNIRNVNDAKADAQLHKKAA